MRRQKSENKPKKDTRADVEDALILLIYVFMLAGLSSLRAQEPERLFLFYFFSRGRIPTYSTRLPARSDDDANASRNCCRFCYTPQVCRTRKGKQEPFI